MKSVNGQGISHYSRWESRCGAKTHLGLPLLSDESQTPRPFKRDIPHARATLLAVISDDFNASTPLASGLEVGERRVDGEAVPRVDESLRRAETGDRRSEGVRLEAGLAGRGGGGRVMNAW